MPKLAVFAPCDQLLVDEEHKSATLIAVMQSFIVEAPADKSIAPDAAKAKEWDILALWHAEGGDIGKTFRQRVQFVLPNGNIAFDQANEFTMSKQWHRQKWHVSILPLGVAGTSHIKIWVHDVQGKEPTEPAAEYPIDIVHKKAGQAE